MGGYATWAACALTNSLSGEGKADHARDCENVMPREFLLPADRMARQATLVGVPRLRYRAKTTNTASWRQGVVDDAETFIQMFRGIIAQNGPDFLAEADARFADFNVDFNVSSTLVQRDINDTSQSGTHDYSVLRTGADAPVSDDRSEEWIPWEAGMAVNGNGF